MEEELEASACSTTEDTLNDGKTTCQMEDISEKKDNAGVSDGSNTVEVDNPDTVMKPDIYLKEGCAAAENTVAGYTEISLDSSKDGEITEEHLTSQTERNVKASEVRETDVTLENQSKIETRNKSEETNVETSKKNAEIDNEITKTSEKVERFEVNNESGVEIENNLGSEAQLEVVEEKPGIDIDTGQESEKKDDTLEKEFEKSDIVGEEDNTKENSLKENTETVVQTSKDSAEKHDTEEDRPETETDKSEIDVDNSNVSEPKHEMAIDKPDKVDDANTNKEDVSTEECTEGLGITKPHIPSDDNLQLPSEDNIQAKKTTSSDPPGERKKVPDNVSSRGTAVRSAAPPRGRGYQESRRYDRDRRDNWRKVGKGESKQSTESLPTAADKRSTSAKDLDSKRDTNLPEKSQLPKSGSVEKMHANSNKNNSSRSDNSKSQAPSRTPVKAREERYADPNGKGRRNERGGRRDSDRDSYKEKEREKESYREKERDRDKRRPDAGRPSSSDKGNERGKIGKPENVPELKSGAELLNMLQQSKDGKPPEKVHGKPKGKEVKGKGTTASDLELQWQKEEEQKRKIKEEEEKKAEEEKRLEEERIRAEEERKIKEEEDARRKLEEEIKSLEDYINETTDRVVLKNELLEENLKAAENHPDDSFFGKLDSSLKKNTAFVKKIRNLTESQKDSIAKDFFSLNLTKYIGEIAQAITEAKLKMSDIYTAIYVCSLLHRRYVEFSPVLLENWQKVLLSKKDEKVPNPSKLRVDLRFFADLVACGVFTQKIGLPILATQLQLLTANDKEEHNNLSILLSFCKHCGDDYAGLVSKKFQELANKHGKEFPRSQVLPKERQKACRNLLKEYYSSLAKHLLQDHKDLKNKEKFNWKTLQTKGELSPERKEQFEAAHQAYLKLYSNTSTLADLLEEDLPDLPDEEFKTDADQIGLDIYSPMKGSEFQYDGDSSLWEDDETRQFYETLPDLKAFIPGILYKDSEQSSDSQEAPSTELTEEEKMEELNVEELEKALQEAMETEELEAVAEKEASNKSPRGLEDKVEEEEMEEMEEEVSTEIEEEDGEIVSSMKVLLDSFLGSLPNCVNRELIDNNAVDFCMKLNTKANRRKLVRTLFTVHRTRYDLLPFYSRLVAILQPCMPDIASDLIQLLKGDFKWHVRKKDQINIESKMKTVRFIGELVKFKVFPKADALHCLKILMFDFRHHNIEMACALLDTCGRFLYRSPESHHATKVYLNVMMRKKVAVHLDQRYTTLIENAYYYSNPPDTKPEAKKIRPPMHEYIRKLVYKDLSKITTEKVLRQIRRLDWDNPDVHNYAAKCLTAIWNVRYNTVHCCANLLAGLAPYHEGVAIQVVDGVLEDIRLGMEVNHPKFNQRRVSAVKYLGELYNYRMVESSVIFKTLYSFITFGVTLDDSQPSPLDPPEHLFRIRLVCVMLDTCGQYFDRGSSKKKLDCFLVYFQRYYWFKKSNTIWTEEHPFPMDVEYLMRDTLEMIRPKMKLHQSYEEACLAAEELDKEFIAKLAEILPKMGEDGVETEDETADGTLSSIQETDEIDELSQGLSQAQVASGTQDTQDSEEEVRTGSQSQRDEGEEGDEEGGVRHREQEDESEEDDLLDSAGETDMDEDVHVLTGGPKAIPCSEDDDFMAAFDKMLTDTITARSNESVKVPQVDIAVPMHIKGQQKPKVMSVPTMHLFGPSPDPSPPASQPDPQELSQPEQEPKIDNSMQFTLLTKRGNKQQFSILNVPLSAAFAAKFRERTEAEQMEKERMKRVVLDIHERQEEEDYQEMIASMSRPATVNTNRERKVRYQHPKGAPDADLIFGSKKC